MLWRCGGFSRWFLAITLVKAIDASCRIDQLLFARKERVTSGTDFDVQITFASRARLERFAASAGDCNFNVFGVNSWFHLLLRHSLSAAPGRIFKHTMIGAEVLIVKFLKGRVPVQFSKTWCHPRPSSHSHRGFSPVTRSRGQDENGFNRLPLRARVNR